jgi:transcriptional regulator with XRE-family HTH domain
MTAEKKTISLQHTVLKRLQRPQSPEGKMFKQVSRIEPTPLATFVRQKLEELHITQSTFCRTADFDQGLLSKVLRSMTTNLGLQNALKLAIGLHVPPKTIFELIDREDLHDLLMNSCARHHSRDQVEQESTDNRQHV